MLGCGVDHFGVAEKVRESIDVVGVGIDRVNLRLKQYHSLALQTVPVGEAGPRSGPVVLFDPILLRSPTRLALWYCLNFLANFPSGSCDR